ncbi:MurR/RpiR family transcriptional regulator, partial [Segatella hominis]|uniref:MurR/RpiR family transcriptional regulator n=1 Tax=Segatella hominis TaxID=2518605 RepID=UPI0021C8C6A5
MEKNPQVMSYITLRELSSSLEVTEITVLKTCQSLGFDGFNELKYEFRKNSIAKRKTDVLDEKNFYTESIPEYESEDERKFLKEVGESEVQMTAQFWEEVNLTDIFRAAGMLLSKKKIYICGRGISYLLAQCMVAYLYGCDCYASVVNTELNEEVYGVLSE